MKTTNLAAVGLFGLLAACGRSGPGNATYSLSTAEMRFGVSPTRNRDVVYQPDVIVMEHGADAIRSQSTNGFTWTFDANAPGASQIQLDRILFATGRVVGRVLRLERNGNDLDVTLGPVELTDIIAEAHIVSHGTLDPANMIVYMAPAGYPGSFENRDAAEADAPAAPSTKSSDRSPIRVYTASRGGELIPLRPTGETSRPACGEDARAPFRVMQAVYVVSGSDEQGGCAQPWLVGSGTPAVADIAAVLLDGFHIFPDVSNGLGIRVPYDKNGMKFLARLNLRLDHPDFTFRLDISHGLKTAAVELSGVGGIDVGIEGGTSGEFKNVNETFAIPVDISFPIAGPLPFAATFHQSLLVQTMFTVKQAVIRANGDYSLGGKITAGIINGAPTGKAPLFLKTTQNLANSLSGISPGVNGLVLGYGGKLIVGLGAFHLVIGPYASINTTVGITRGSDLQTATVGYTCRSAQLDLALDYGLGFAVPAWTAKALNFALSFFHAKPISASYSTKLGTLPIKSVTDAVPPSCAATPT